MIAQFFHMTRGTMQCSCICGVDVGQYQIFHEAEMLPNMMHWLSATVAFSIQAEFYLSEKKYERYT